MMKEVLIQVRGCKHMRKRFCAGVVMQGDRVIATAPILRRWIIRGMGMRGIIAVCRAKEWEWSRVSPG